MYKFRRDVDHKLRVLQHADKISDVGKACRYFGVGRASFFRWRTAYRQHGLAGLENRKTAPKNPANRTSPEIVEKVLHLRKTYRLGPIRIVWSRSFRQVEGSVSPRRSRSPDRSLIKLTRIAGSADS